MMTLTVIHYRRNKTKVTILPIAIRIYFKMNNTKNFTSI